MKSLHSVHNTQVKILEFMYMKSLHSVNNTQVKILEFMYMKSLHSVHKTQVKILEFMYMKSLHSLNSTHGSNLQNVSKIIYLKLHSTTKVGNLFSSCWVVNSFSSWSYPGENVGFNEKKSIITSCSIYVYACTVQECESLMEKGWKNRTTGSTLMNADSSRSAKS